MSQLRPAAPPFKVVLFYAASGGFGFSEVVWHNGTSMSDSLSWAEAQYLPMRLGLANADITCIGVRASDASQPRRIQTWVPGAGMNAGTFGGTSNKSLHPDLSLLVKQIAPDWSYSFRYLAGLPSEVYTPPASINNVPGWVNNLGSYLNTLKATVLVQRNKVGGSQPIVQPVASAESHGIRERRRGRPFGLPHGVSEAR